jgi:7,8-dihydropterin-6-yl-methyl-4-(beta-D-ribofuranosyl)aminobenzene 5'-phosphate synthase
VIHDASVLEGGDMTNLKRREFLKASAALAAASAAGGFGCVEIADAAAIQVPVVDKVSVRVVIDGAYNLFLRPGDVKGVKIERPPREADYRRAIHNEWGLSLVLESQRAAEQRTVMLDFGYTPTALLNNLELLGVDPKKVEALIVSHGHYDHFGGLIGFLDKFRSVLPADITLYAGGEDNFCTRHQVLAVQGMPQQGEPGLSQWGTLDRRELASRNVKTVLAENPVVIGHAFTTGKIKRRTVEQVSGGARVEYAMKDGFGCNASHFAPAEQLGKIVPDEHHHEHATCFSVRDKGLVVVSSCGHVGIVNSARQAQEVSGVQKVHALVGGFHLGATPDGQLKKVIDEIKALNPDVIIPMHCSGDNFARAVRETMPDKLIQPSTGARLTFGA